MDSLGREQGPAGRGSSAQIHGRTKEQSEGLRAKGLDLPEARGLQGVVEVAALLICQD